MRNKPSLSIIVPVYNVENYIEQCARSLLEQTLNDIEYIFIDDCSIDNSFTILQEIINEYPHRKSNVRLLRNSENMGVARTREKGILMSTGQYINTCDSDDWYDLEMFQSMLDIARSQNSKLVISDMQQHDANGETHILRAYEKNDDLISSLLRGKTIPFINTSIFSRDILTNPLFSFPVSDMGDDMLLSIELAFFFDHPIYIPCHYYHYRYNPQSITKSISFDSYIHRTTGLYNNAQQIFNFLKIVNVYEKYSQQVYFYKHIVKSSILPAIGNNKALILWRECFPEIVWEVVFDKSFSKKTRFYYFLTEMGVYPIYKRIKAFFIASWK